MPTGQTSPQYILLDCCGGYQTNSSIRKLCISDTKRTDADVAARDAIVAAGGSYLNDANVTWNKDFQYEEDVVPRRCESVGGE
jgi:hypothetical protein